MMGWWRWRMKMMDGSSTFSGSSYSNRGHALNAALFSALRKSVTIIQIEIIQANI